MSAAASPRLSRTAAGRLEFERDDGTRTQVVPVRAFPISAPFAGLALVDVEGHELAWFDTIEAVPEPDRGLVEEELAAREFMPEIRAILGVSSFVTPSTWRVVTDRGETAFVLGGEEFIRRLGPGAFLVADTQGIHYLIRDAAALDKASRKLLDRFL